MNLALELDGERFAPGETVSGRVRVVAGGSTRALEVTLRFFEETPDFKRAASTIASGPLHSGDLQGGQLFPFALSLPPDALPGASSNHAELYWQLDARSDEAGLDTHARARIQVAVSPASPRLP